MLPFDLRGPYKTIISQWCAIYAAALLTGGYEKVRCEIAYWFSEWHRMADKPEPIPPALALMTKR